MAALQGKDDAIASYDQMLWKIRAGYCTVLYGVLVLGLAVSDSWTVPISRAAMIAVILITGLTICAVALDFTFLSSNLRVVDAKERWVDIVWKMASGQTIEAAESPTVASLLHSSGESRTPIDFTNRAPLWPIVLLYGGRWAAGLWAAACAAVTLLA